MLHHIDCQFINMAKSVTCFLLKTEPFIPAHDTSQNRGPHFNDDQGRLMIMKSESTVLYTELIWNTEEFNNIKNRKLILCSSIWNNFVSNKYSYIKILYFRHYDFSYCSKRIASYKKILKSDSLPSVIKNASKMSEEVNIISTDEYDVYAMESIVWATEKSFKETCSLLHDSQNTCFVILGNTEEFITSEHWTCIYNILNHSQYLPDSILRNLLGYINTTEALVRTYGFFDDSEIGFSIYVRSK